MQAAALLATNKKPTREQIVTHMDGNICRCGTYPRIVRAIERAAREGWAMHQDSNQASVATTVTRRSFVEGAAALTFAFALGGVAGVPEALGAMPRPKISDWAT